MAWTQPRTFVVGELVDESHLNTHIRDNLNVLSTHGHSGAGGMGSTSPTGLAKATFADASAPAAPGAGKTRIYAVSGDPHFRAGASGADTTLVTPALSDTLVNRPAFGTVGRIFYESDTGKIDLDTGAAWTTIIDVDAAVGTPSLRTLGTGALQAAAGNHGH